MELRPYQQQAKDAIFSLNGRTASKKRCWCCQQDAEKQLSLQRLQKNVLREEAAS